MLETAVTDSCTEATYLSLTPLISYACLHQEETRVTLRDSEASQLYFAVFQ